MTFQTHRMEATDATRRTLDERTKSLKLENRQYDPHFFTSYEGNTKGSSSEVGQGDPHEGQTRSPNDV